MIIVTGCSGYVGSRVVRFLDELEIPSFGISRNCTFNSKFHSCKSIDLLKQTSYSKLLDFSGAVLINCAWIATPKIFWNSAENTEWLTATRKLAETFFASGGKHFINIGSSAEYRVDEIRKIETVSTPPVESIYSKCKFEFSRFLMTSEYKFSNLRVFNLYGPRQPTGKFITDLSSACVKSEHFVIKRPNDIRDFVYIDDLVNVINEVIQFGPVGNLNVGTGNQTKVADFAKRIIDIFCPEYELLEIADNFLSNEVVSNTEKFKTLFPNFQWTDINYGLNQIKYSKI